MKEKIKNFWKEHNKEIILCGLGLTVGCYAGYRHAIPWKGEIRRNIYKVLSSGKPGLYGVTTISDDITVKTEDLGELGKRMIELGANFDGKWNKFIVIGDPIKK